MVFEVILSFFTLLNDDYMKRIDSIIDVLLSEKEICDYNKKRKENKKSYYKHLYKIKKKEIVNFYLKTLLFLVKENQKPVKFKRGILKKNLYNNVCHYLKNPNNFRIFLDPKHYTSNSFLDMALFIEY